MIQYPCLQSLSDCGNGTSLSIVPFLSKSSFKLYSVLKLLD